MSLDEVVLAASEEGRATITFTSTDLPAEETVVRVEVRAALICKGDCDSDGTVTIDELVTGVNIALGLASPELCPALGSGADRPVTIDDLVSAVQGALNGCG